MVNRTGFFAMAVLLATTLVPATLRAAAEEPVATAQIPPLPAVVPPAPPATPAPKAAVAVPAKPIGPFAVKPGGAAARKTIEHRRMATHRLHRRTERRRLIAQLAPPHPVTPPRYYPGPVAGPQAFEHPSMPPPWYDRGRPLAFYPYPGPRGPMPPW